MKNISKTGIFTLLLTSSLTIMVGTVIAPSLTEISRHLGFADNPGWLVTLPSLGVVLFAPVMGWIIDRKGAFRMMCWGLVPYAILGVAGAALTNPYIVIVDRILLGAATAAVMASGTVLIAELFQDQDRMKMIAWQGMAIELGGVVFLSIGGILGQIGWQLPFYIYLIALVCAVLTMTSVPQKALHIEARHEPGSSAEPGNLLTIVMSAGFAMILFFTAFVGLPLMLPQAFDFSESQTGYFMGFISLVAVGAASIMPRVAARLGGYYTVALGYAFLTAGLILFSVATHFVVLLLAAVSTGIGFGFTVPLLNHMTLQLSSPSSRGKNLGYYSMGIFGGQFLSSFITLISDDIKVTFLAASLIGFLVAIGLAFKAKSNCRAELV